MSNKSYSIIIGGKDDLTYLFEYLRKSGALSSLSNFMISQKALKTQLGTSIPEGVLLANIIVDRSDLLESINYEHGIAWNPVFFALDEFKTSKVRYSESEMKTNHQKMVDYMKKDNNQSWISFDEHKKLYNHHYVAKNMRYLESKGEKWTEKEALSMLSSFQP